MQIKKIDGAFSVCKVADVSKVNFNDLYCFIGITDEEKSLVCLTASVPDNTTQREDGWAAFRVQGVLDFSLVGVLAKISTLLAEHQIGLFAISTYNTDYILVKQENHCKALHVLAGAGYQIIS